jgi:tetratricopeptide (TPR) repeat protein
MDSGEILDASENLNTAIGRYERALAERRFKPAPEFAKSYSLLADIHYRDWRDFPAALANYEKAEQHGYTRPETDYRQGFIYYQDQTQPSMEKALQFFYRAGLEREPSPYLLLATGNTLFERSNFFAASGYYSMLVNQVQHELDTINLPRPQEKRSHEEIVELLMVARNNLGVAKYRTAERMGDARQRSEAMVEFLASAKLFDSLSRDQVRMTRSETRNLGFLNTDFVLHPQRGIDLALYKDLPMEMIFPAE